MIYLQCYSFMSTIFCENFLLDIKESSRIYHKMILRSFKRNLSDFYIYDFTEKTTGQSLSKLYPREKARTLI